MPAALCLDWAMTAAFLALQVFNNRLRIWKDLSQPPEERILTSDGQLVEVLKEQFGLHISLPALGSPPTMLPANVAGSLERTL
jgi:hypothetical protein